MVKEKDEGKREGVTCSGKNVSNSSVSKANVKGTCGTNAVREYKEWTENKHHIYSIINKPIIHSDN